MTDILADFPPDRATDRPLALVQFANACRFLEGAEDCAARARDSDACYGLAIFVELALKAYLLATATNDEWNRRHIRHDLAKAALYAAHAGLPLPARLPEIVKMLHPHFQDGGFHRCPQHVWPPGFPSLALAVCRELAANVADSASLRMLS